MRILVAIYVAGKRCGLMTGKRWESGSQELRLWSEIEKRKYDQAVHSWAEFCWPTTTTTTATGQTLKTEKYLQTHQKVVDKLIKW